MAKRLISNSRLPSPTPSFTGTRNKATALGVASGELGMNVESDMDEDCWGEDSEWRDAHGIWRANCLDPLPDF